MQQDSASERHTMAKAVRSMGVVRMLCASVASVVMTIASCGPEAENATDASPPMNDAARVDASTGPAADASGPTADAGDPDGDWVLLPPPASGAWVRVRNLCPHSLWIHAAGSSGALSPDDAELASGQTRDYEAPAAWSAARVTAYKDGPRSGEIEKAEMTLSPATGAVSLNYNITYVDWVGLPMRMAGAGGNCGAAHVVGCFVGQSALLAGCPAHLVDGDRCQSARSYCLNPANQGTAYCHALDGEIATCAATRTDCQPFAAATTPEVYACSGVLATEPRLCAALNRGMVQDPDNNNEALFYTSDPHNTYARWVHDVCPGIYAFSYDDWLGHGGFRSCEGTELRLTFCPAG